MVKIIPSFPACNDWCKFIPKPKPTTEIWSRYFDNFFVSFEYGTPIVRDSNIPKKRAIAGVKKNDATKSNINNITFCLCYNVWHEKDN